MVRRVRGKASQRLRIVVGALRVYLVRQVLLEDVLLVARGVRLRSSDTRILLLQRLQHVRARRDLRCIALERLQLVLARRHHCLLWVCRADVVVLEALRASDPVSLVASRLRRVLAVRRQLLAALRLLARSVERDLNAATRVAYLESCLAVTRLI
jgi:hypothetical protein